MNNMRLPKFTYHEPTNLAELLSIKQELKQDCALLAGGTDLIPMLKRRNRIAPHVLNIKSIPELSQISFSKEKGLHIGCAVTLRDIIEHPVVTEKYPLLAQAAGAVGFNQLRNMATLGGNVCLDNKCSYFNQSVFWWKSRPDCFKRGGDRCYVVKGGKECFSLFLLRTRFPLSWFWTRSCSSVGPRMNVVFPLRTFTPATGGAS